jgi:hypothetical protein
MPLAAGLASDRVAAVFAQAGITVEIAAAHTSARSARPATAERRRSSDIGGDERHRPVVADQGDGSVLAQFLDSRGDDVWIPTELTHADLSWEQTDDLVNDVTVEWPGGAPANATSPGSITEYDRHATAYRPGSARSPTRSTGLARSSVRLAYPAWAIAGSTLGIPRRWITG